MPTYEGLRLKVLKYKRKLFMKSRRKKINKTEFTIISNNCWGGMIYESYGLKKQSPTVGMFIMAEDYILFLKHLKEFLSAELKFVSPDEARHKAELCRDERWGNYPIGLLKIPDGGGYISIEIYFLHHHSQAEAEEKWKRRCERVNWKHLLVKFNDQNGCTEDLIRQFDELPYRNKICFTVKEYPQYKSVIRIKVPKSHTYIRASYEPFGNNKYCDINKIINEL